MHPTVWPQYTKVTDIRQRSDRRIVLQTVAQKYRGIRITPVWETFITLRLTIDMAYLCTKFDDWGIRNLKGDRVTMTKPLSGVVRHP